LAEPDAGSFAFPAGAPDELLLTDDVVEHKAMTKPAEIKISRFFFIIILVWECNF
jgi:hypothetical protein